MPWACARWRRFMSLLWTVWRMAETVHSFALPRGIRAHPADLCKCNVRKLTWQLETTVLLIWVWNLDFLGFFAIFCLLVLWSGFARFFTRLETCAATWAEHELSGLVPSFLGTRGFDESSCTLLFCSSRACRRLLLRSLLWSFRALSLRFLGFSSGSWKAGSFSAP